MKALAASYASGEAGGGEVDLSGVDESDSLSRPGQQRTVSRISRSGSAGGAGGEGAAGPLQHRISHSAAADHGAGQCQLQGQSPASEGGGGRIVGKEDTLAAHGQESLESVLNELKDAEALVKRLRKDLDRANLERGGMESMVGTGKSARGGGCSISSCTKLDMKRTRFLSPLIHWRGSRCEIRKDLKGFFRLRCSAVDEMFLKCFHGEVGWSFVVSFLEVTDTSLIAARTQLPVKLIRR